MLDELYQELILDHGRKPRNFGMLEGSTHQAEGHNPFCGDQVRVFARLEEGRIAEISFEGCGCAISTASASLMTQAVKGKTMEEANSLFEKFHQAATTDTEPCESLGEIACLCGVRQYPNRVKCATLAWHALAEAISKEPHA